MEDSPTVARIMRTMVARSLEEFELRHCERLGDALDHLRHNAVGCVLLDLSLPDAEGLDGVIQLRRLAPGSPRSGAGER